MGWRDEWPSAPDGQQYDGKELMNLVKQGRSPFRDIWDVKLLVREVEENLKIEVIDIPIVDKGSNNYGLRLHTSDDSDVVARLARGDVNMPDYDGFTIDKRVPEILFEAATYNLLRNEPRIRASRLLYHRVPVQHAAAGRAVPSDISGRSLLVFERAKGENNVWDELMRHGKLILLDQLAQMRAALFQLNPSPEFSAKYLHDRIFDFKPEKFAMPVAPTREFWIHVMQSKIEATIREQGDMIGWEDDDETAGPVALMAKKSLLRAIPHIFPPETKGGSLYRFVLEHGDFGIHNTSITLSDDRKPLITSLYDWETGCIVPALLSDPLVAVRPVDLIVNEKAEAAVTRIPKAPTAAECEGFVEWARHYIKQLYHDAPDYKVAIRAGRDVRHLWFALRDWRGGDSEKFFGGLGAWAEDRMKDMDVLKSSSLKK